MVIDSLLIGKCLFLMQNIDKIPLVACPVLVIHVSIYLILLFKFSSDAPLTINEVDELNICCTALKLPFINVVCTMHLLKLLFFNHACSFQFGLVQSCYVNM